MCIYVPVAFKDCVSKRLYSDFKQPFLNLKLNLSNGNNHAYFKTFLLKKKFILPMLDFEL